MRSDLRILYIPARWSPWSSYVPLESSLNPIFSEPIDRPDRRAVIFGVLHPPPFSCRRRRKKLILVMLGVDLRWSPGLTLLVY